METSTADQIKTVHEKDGRDKEVSLGMMIPESLHTEARILAIKRRISQRALWIQAMREFIERQPESPAA